MAKKLVIYRDAEGAEFGLKVVDTVTGERSDVDGFAIAARSDLFGTDETYHQVKLRQATVCIQGNSRAAIVFMSEDFDPTAP